MKRYKKIKESGGELMKRVVCILSLVALLFVGSMVVFADPYAVPDIDSVSLVNPPVVTVDEPASE